MNNVISLLAIMVLFFSGSTKHEILDGVYFIIRHEKILSKEIPVLYYSPHNFILFDKIDNQLRNWTEEEQYVSMAKAQHKEYNPDSIDWNVGFDGE